jgi:tRNA dimethylallyltransferase
MQSHPLIAVVGETASGKSALALNIAERFNGEIICADSRTVYKGMDIGTAKPSQDEQAKAPHYLLDIVNPDESFNVSTFQSLAIQKIDEIAARNKLPILVGGTGLYVDSVLFNFAFRKRAEPELRAELEDLPTEELQERIKDAGIDMPLNSQNRRHLIRSIETAGEISQKKDVRENTLVIGLSIPKEELEERIEQRVASMINNGLEAEVRSLSGQYGWDTEAMSAVGYREWQAYFEGTQTLEETKQLIVITTRQYAKRQRTWFKRNSYIHWFTDAASALAFAENWLIAASSSGQNPIITSEE